MFVLASLDTVLPISGEASCRNCHASTDDVPVSPDAPHAGIATQPLTAANLPVITAFDDPEYRNLPANVSIEYATDINLLRLHDYKHGGQYINSAGAATPCVISAGSPNGNGNCLTNKALVQHKPVVCQVCHYTPALDLAQFGPLSGDARFNDSLANGRVQRAHTSNSAVMHYHHGSLTKNGQKLFPNMPALVQDSAGNITNQAARLAALEQACYQCHPGKNTKCLRGAMFNRGLLCSDCHGNMQQVGNDFSRGVLPSNPSAFKLGLGNFYNPASAQPRVPWANEPGCGSCHTGDARSNLAGTTGTIRNLRDTYGNVDRIRLMRAFRTGDAKATPIVPTNKRFAENTVQTAFNGFVNSNAGNPNYIGRAPATAECSAKVVTARPTPSGRTETRSLMTMSPPSRCKGTPARLSSAALATVPVLIRGIASAARMVCTWWATPASQTAVTRISRRTISGPVPPATRSYIG